MIRSPWLPLDHRPEPPREAAVGCLTLAVILITLILLAVIILR